MKGYSLYTWTPSWADKTNKYITNSTSALTVLLFSAKDVCKANYSPNKQRDRALNALILVTSVEAMKAWEESTHMCTNASFRQTCHSKMDQFRVLMKSGWGSSCVVVPMDAMNPLLLNKRCNLGPRLLLKTIQTVLHLTEESRGSVQTVFFICQCMRT